MYKLSNKKRKRLTRSRVCYNSKEIRKNLSELKSEFVVRDGFSIESIFKMFEIFNEHYPIEITEKDDIEDMIEKYKNQCNADYIGYNFNTKRAVAYFDEPTFPSSYFVFFFEDFLKLKNVFRKEVYEYLCCFMSSWIKSCQGSYEFDMIMDQYEISDNPTYSELKSLMREFDKEEVRNTIQEQKNRKYFESFPERTPIIKPENDEEREIIKYVESILNFNFEILIKYTEHASVNYADERNFDEVSDFETHKNPTDDIRDTVYSDLCTLFFACNSRYSRTFDYYHTSINERLGNMFFYGEAYFPVELDKKQMYFDWDDYFELQNFIESLDKLSDIIYKYADNNED